VPETAIEVRDARVTYRVTSEHRVTVKERLGRTARAREVTLVEAVRGVSFDVKVGEIVGLVGSNGSGKSSLLRAIAGLHALESGSIRVRGEPALLGVGAVLNKKLSGARNIWLGCLALGMTREETGALFDDIVEFSGLRHAIDRPMRTYSSGMRSRLSFAIATAVRPDILLVDEVLSVGDIRFRKRASARLAEMRGEAAAVILVSHNLREIEKLCTRALWMEEGRLVMDAAAALVVETYGAGAES